MIFKILKIDLSSVLHRSVVRSSADVAHWNKHVTFKSDIQEALDKLDARPSAIIPRKIQAKQRSRKPIFPIELDPIQVLILTRLLFAEQDLKYMLCVT